MSLRLITIRKSIPGDNFLQIALDRFLIFRIVPSIFLSKITFHLQHFLHHDFHNFPYYSNSFHKFFNFKNIVLISSSSSRLILVGTALQKADPSVPKPAQNFPQIFQTGSRLFSSLPPKSNPSIFLALSSLLNS